ncbi:uncharacterized protein METZ01_LOCUS194413, partial [marine metagenome]
MMQALSKKSNLEGLIYAIFSMCHYVPPSQTSGLADQVTGYLRRGCQLAGNRHGASTGHG